MLGKGEAAARYFLDAAPLRPDDELAVANKVLAYHLLQDKETRERVAFAVDSRTPAKRRRDRVRSLQESKGLGKPCHKAWARICENLNLCALSTSTSCRDIFPFGTARQARSHVRTNLVA
jgi:hypothetical protein